MIRILVLVSIYFSIDKLNKGSIFKMSLYESSNGETPIELSGL